MGDSIMSFKLILIAGIIAKLYGNEDNYCCTSKIVGGIEYLLEGKISNPYDYDCLNGCIYTRIDEDPNIKYCFKQGPHHVECQDYGCNKHCSSCNRGSQDYVISGDSYDERRFPIENVLTWSIPEVYRYGTSSRFANYWLAPLNSSGQFILKFDQPRTVDTITIVNTFNGDENRDSGTEEFKVYLGETEDGPWTEVLHNKLDDVRNTNQNLTSVPAQIFSINPTCGKFVKFEIISWYGVRGGLQYFSTCPLKCGEGWTPYKNKCYKTYSPESDISWEDANFNCNNKRGQLASIPNEETNEFMTFLSPTERTLIGGFATGKAPNPDLWTWTDGTPWTYTKWAPDRPNNVGAGEYCLEMNRDQDQIGEWNDVVCYESSLIPNSSYLYICQKYPEY